MNKPHVHAEVIKAWADGAEIEYFHNSRNKWVSCTEPLWNSNSKYRVKPAKPKVTHKIGNIYQFYNGKRMLAACGDLEAVMVLLDGPYRGCRTNDSVKVKDFFKISEEEFLRLANLDSDYTLVEE